MLPSEVPVPRARKKSLCKRHRFPFPAAGFMHCPFKKNCCCYFVTYSPNHIHMWVAGGEKNITKTLFLAFTQVLKSFSIISFFCRIHCMVSCCQLKRFISSSLAFHENSTKTERIENYLCEWCLISDVMMLLMIWSTPPSFQRQLREINFFRLKIEEKFMFSLLYRWHSMAVVLFSAGIGWYRRNAVR